MTDFPFAALAHRGIWHVQLTPDGPWVAVYANDRAQALLRAEWANK